MKSPSPPKRSDEILTIPLVFPFFEVFRDTVITLNVLNLIPVLFNEATFILRVLRDPVEVNILNENQPVFSVNYHYLGA